MGLAALVEGYLRVAEMKMSIGPWRVIADSSVAFERYALTHYRRTIETFDRYKDARDAFMEIYEREIRAMG